MNLTRLSLFYPVAYLFGGGLGLLLMPHLALRMLLSNAEYGDIMPRLAGVLTVGLAVIVLQIIRHRADKLYPTLIGVRLFFIATYAALYAMGGDPSFWPWAPSLALACCSAPSATSRTVKTPSRLEHRSA